MRLAACALSAVLLSGCSWLGSGGSYGDSYGYGYNGVYNGCMQGGASANFANAGYGYAGGSAGGCAQGAGYGVAHGGGMYGAGGGMYGAGGGAYGAGAGMYGAGSGMGVGGAGLRGAYGVNGYGTGLQGAGGLGGAGMYAPGGAGAFGGGTGISGLGAGVAGLGAGAYGAGSGFGGGGITTLSSAAPYGAAVGGIQTLPGGGTVQTVQGAPIYVPQPYPAYYQAQSYSGGYNYGGGFGGGSLPFGLELGGGQDFIVGGDIFPGDVSKPFGGTGGTTPVGATGVVSDLIPIGYADAFDNAKGVDLTATYDVNHNMTLLGRVGYTKADGNALKVGTVTDGGTVTEDLYAEFSDLEQYTIEGGFRKYMGYPTGMRPYIGGTAGFVKTKDVDLTQASATLVDPAVFTQTYVDGGWSPTASGLIGAEWAMGNRSAIGVETGIRWTDDLDSNFVSDDRWSVPVRLRGRVSF